MATTPFTITNWFETKPASLVTKRRKIIRVSPDLSKVAYPWTGTSVLTTQWNYTVDERFTLFRVPAKPLNCMYFMTIGYRVGDNHVEYWIFDHPYTDIVENETYHKYTNQVILPNFSIRLYTVDYTAEQADADAVLESLQLPLTSTSDSITDEQELETSLLTVPTDLRNYGSTEFSAGTDIGTPTLDFNVIDYIDNTQGAWLDNEFSYEDAV